MPSIRDFLTESVFLQSPSQFIADEKLTERLAKLGPTSGRTRSQLDVLGQERAGFERLAEGAEVASENIGTERRQLRADVSSASAQAGPQGVTAGTTLGDTLRRAKARQGIVNRGDAAIANQRLKDRIAAVRSGIAQKATAIDLQGAGAQIRAGVNLSAQRGRDAISAARAGALGTTAGAFTAGIKEKRKAAAEADD